MTQDAEREVAVDFASDDGVSRCPHCPHWRREHVTVDGETVTREWHSATCPVVTSWS